MRKTPIENVCYTLNYDTIYGQLDPKVMFREIVLKYRRNKIALFSSSSINDVSWKNYDIDYLIESTGVLKNVEDSAHLIENNDCKRVFITHSLTNSSILQCVRLQ